MPSKSHLMVRSAPFETRLRRLLRTSWRVSNHARSQCSSSLAGVSQFPDRLGKPGQREHELRVSHIGRDTSPGSHAPPTIGIDRSPTLALTRTNHEHTCRSPADLPRDRRCRRKMVTALLIRPDITCFPGLESQNFNSMPLIRFCLARARARALGKGAFGRPARLTMRAGL